MAARPGGNASPPLTRGASVTADDRAARVRRATPDDLEQLNRFDPFPGAATEFQALRLHLLRRRLAAAASEPRTADLLVAEGPQALGVALLRQRAWDSAHFGMPVGAIEEFHVQGPSYEAEAELCRALLDACTPIIAPWRYVTCRIPSEAVAAAHALEEHGFRYLVAMMTLVCRLDDAAPGPLPPGVRRASEKDARALSLVAQRCFSGSRFHVDPVFTTDRADALHVHWIENCLRGDLADVVFVVEHAGAVAGFLAWRAREEYADWIHGEIVLVGLRADCRGHGLGRRLVQAAVEWTRGRGHGVVVRTEAENFASLHTYLAVGFRLAELSTYFRWYAPSAGARRGG